MAGRGKIKIFEVLRDDSRREIVSAIEKAENNSPSIADLSKILNINRGTLKHHLLILERAGIIGKKRASDELGAPARFFSKRKEYAESLGKQASEHRKEDMGKNKEKMIKLLSYIERNKLSKRRLISTSLGAVSLAEALEQEGYLDSVYFLTEKGKRFLKGTI